MPEHVERWLTWYRTNDPAAIASLAPQGGALAAIAPGMASASAFYAVHDGQPLPEDLEVPPVYEGYRWMTLAEVAKAREDLDGMAKVGEWDDDKYQHIDWWVPGWVPLLTDDTSNYVCIDTIGSFGGAPGQLVEFIHDNSAREVLAPSFDAWFAAWVALLEAGGLKRGTDPDEPCYELTAAGKRLRAELVPGYPRAHRATKQKKPKAPAKRVKKPKASNDPLLGVFKQRMTASDIAAEIAAGADVHARDAEGKTPLHLAMSCGSEAPAQALLGAGADANATTATGVAPLHLAALGNARTAPSLIATLVRAGADPNLRDAKGAPPLAHALSVEAFQALLDHGADPKLSLGDQTLAQHLQHAGRAAAIVELAIAAAEKP